jgi:hypothetical protein
MAPSGLMLAGAQPGRSAREHALGAPSSTQSLQLLRGNAAASTWKAEARKRWIVEFITVPSPE